MKDFLVKNKIYWLFLSFLALTIVLKLLAVSGVVFLIIGFILLLIIFFLFRDLFLGAIFLFFFLPFDRLPSFEVSGFTLKIDHLVILAFIIYFLYHLIKNRKFKGLDFKPLAVLTPLILAMLLSFKNSQDLSRSLIILAFILFTASVFVLIPNVVKNKTNLRIIMAVILLSTFLILIFGIYQYSGDVFNLSPAWTGLREVYTKRVLSFPRIQSTLIEPLYLADFLLIPAGLFLSFWLTKLLKWQFWQAFLFGLIFLVVFLLTASRGGYVGAIGLLIVIAIFQFKDFVSKDFLKFLFSILFVSIGAVYFLLRLASPLAPEAFFLHNRGPLTGVEEPAVAERSKTSQVAIKAFREEPILGIGIGNFGPYYASYPTQAPEGGWQTTNNQYLEILAETGILGLVAFGFLNGFILWRSFRAWQEAQDKFLKIYLLGTTAAIMGILIQYYFFSTLYIIHIWAILGLVWAVQNLILKKTAKLST